MRSAAGSSSCKGLDKYVLCCQVFVPTLQVAAEKQAAYSESRRVSRVTKNEMARGIAGRGAGIAAFSITC